MVLKFLSANTMKISSNEFRKRMDSIDRRPHFGLQSVGSLSHILHFQALFGVTYFGNISFDRKPEALKRSILICYDLFFYLLIFSYLWRGFNEETFERIFGRSSNKGIMNFVFRAAALAVALEFFFIKGILAVNGSKLTSIVNSFGMFSLNIDCIFSAKDYRICSQLKRNCLHLDLHVFCRCLRGHRNDFLSYRYDKSQRMGFHVLHHNRSDQVCGQVVSQHFIALFFTCDPPSAQR